MRTRGLDPSPAAPAGGLLVAGPGNRHARAEPAEEGRDRAADATAPSGDESVAAGKREHAWTVPAPAPTRQGTYRGRARRRVLAEECVDRAPRLVAAEDLVVAHLPGGRTRSMRAGGAQRRSGCEWAAGVFGVGGAVQEEDGDAHPAARARPARPPRAERAERSCLASAVSTYGCGRQNQPARSRTIDRQVGEGGRRDDGDDAVGRRRPAAAPSRRPEGVPESTARRAPSVSSARLRRPGLVVPVGAVVPGRSGRARGRRTRAPRSRRRAAGARGPGPRRGCRRCRAGRRRVPGPKPFGSSEGRNSQPSIRAPPLVNATVSYGISGSGRHRPAHRPQDRRRGPVDRRDAGRGGDDRTDEGEAEDAREREPRAAPRARPSHEGEYVAAGAGSSGAARREGRAAAC